MSVTECVDSSMVLGFGEFVLRNRDSVRLGLW